MLSGNRVVKVEKLEPLARKVLDMTRYNPYHRRLLVVLTVARIGIIQQSVKGLSSGTALATEYGKLVSAIMLNSVFASIGSGSTGLGQCVQIEEVSGLRDQIT
jgi:hypothetical protein